MYMGVRDRPDNWTDRQIGGRTDRQTDNIPTGSQTDRQLDRRTNIQTYIQTNKFRLVISLSGRLRDMASKGLRSIVNSCKTSPK